MLNTASGQPRTASQPAEESDPEKPTGFKALLGSFSLSSKARVRIPQAGMNGRARPIGGRHGAGWPFPGSVWDLFPVPVERPGHRHGRWRGIGASMPYVYVSVKRKKRLDTLEEQFPEALDFLARSMRAGHAFSISLEMLGEELEQIRWARNSAPFSTSRTWARRSTSPCAISPTRVPLLDARFFTSSVLLQKQTGGNLSEILSRLAYVIRERFRLKGQVKAASAHGRLTATILTVLPMATMLRHAARGARISEGHGRRSRRQEAHRRRHRGPGPRQFFHQADHQHQGVKMYHPFLLSICVFVDVAGGPHRRGRTAFSTSPASPQTARQPGDRDAEMRRVDGAAAEPGPAPWWRCSTSSAPICRPRRRRSPS